MSIKVLVADDHEVVRQGLISSVQRLRNQNRRRSQGRRRSGHTGSQASARKSCCWTFACRRPTDSAALEKLRSENAGNQGRHAVDLRQSDLCRRGPSRWGRATTCSRARRRQEIDFRRYRGGTRRIPSKVGEMRRVAGAMATRQATGDDDVPLTNRETQVLRHMALGLSNKEIGRSLTISIETVKEHVQNILRKIAVSDRTQAAVWAVRKGFGLELTRACANCRESRPDEDRKQCGDAGSAAIRECARMRSFISGAQVRRADVRVNLRRDQAFVAQAALARCECRRRGRADAWRSCAGASGAWCGDRGPVSRRYFSSIRPTLRVVSRLPERLTNSGSRGFSAL